MPLLLAEGIVNSVVSYLETNQAAKLQALRVEYDDDVPLPDFEEFRIDDPQEGGLVQALPRVHVLVPIEEIPMWTATTALSGHSLLLWAVWANQDPETIRREGYRYARALWELLVAADAAGSLGGAVLGGDLTGAPPASMDFGATLTSDNQLMADLRIGVRLTVSETTA